MTLLQDLVDGAAGDTVPVPTLLRQLKVVAARTDAAPLAEWVRYELEGYPSDVTVPTYRGPFNGPTLGRFQLLGNNVSEQPMSPSRYPWVWPAAARRITSPIAELEHLIGEAQIGIRWPDEAIEAYNDEVSRARMSGALLIEELISATRLVDRHFIAGLLSAVRCRVLGLALELEKVAPSAGQPNAPAETVAAAQQVITTHFHGPIANVAIASEGTIQSVTVQLPAPGDETMLLRYLGAHGVDPAQLVALREALDLDQQDSGGRHPRRAGARVRAWLTQASTDLGTNAAGGVIGAALTAGLGAFFGG